LINSTAVMATGNLDTGQKARQINLDAHRYGTFAEIGAGQEVARWFFRVGGAAGTVAKTISAYDMSVSDAIYGPTERYVSRGRLKAMLDYEYDLLLERLDAKRGGGTAFFTFADTVTTRREGGHGWLGIKFQDQPGADPSEIYIHLRMLDKESYRQQEALGVIGVNLIFGSFYSHREPDALIRSLLNSLTWERVEVDMIRFAGPAFAGVDNRLMALELVKGDLTEAAMFTAQGEAVQWAEVLYDKPVLIERGSFRPMTKATLDVLESGLEQFMQEPELKGQTPVVLLEMTLRHLTTGDIIDAKDFLTRRDTLGAPAPPPASLSIDAKDFLARADTLRALGRPVLVSNFRRFHRLAAYLSRYSRQPLGIALGASSLKEIFDESFYNESEGGLLGGLGQLFKNPARLYVYPHWELESEMLITAENYPIAGHLKHLYAYFLENRFIQDIHHYNRQLVGIRRRAVLAQIQAGERGWEELVPAPIVEVIKQEGLFGYHGSEARKLEPEARNAKPA